MLCSAFAVACFADGITGAYAYVMRKYASKVQMPYGQLTFHFDGETLEPQETALALDLDDGFCVDVKGF